MADLKVLPARRRTKEYAKPTSGLGVLRLVCAALVIMDHCWPLTLGAGVNILPGSWQISVGDIAMFAVFAMSGYQVSGSWERDPSWWRYCARRLLRLVPPLLFMLMVTVFVVGPLFTSWSASAYWVHPQTWRYLVGSTVMLLLQHNVPGLFYDNPYPWSVNGSLWTLPIELGCYAVLLAAGLLVVAGVPRLVLLVPMLAGVFVLDGLCQRTLDDGGTVASFLQIPLASLTYFLVPFVLGMVLYAGRDRIPLLRLPALGLIVAWFLLRGAPAIEQYLLPVAVTYGTLVLGHHWPRRFGRSDLWVRGSYGMYLWGFLLQQVIVSFGVRNPWVLLAIAIPVSYLCGVLSWTCIEKPTQRFTRYLRVPQPASPVSGSPQRELQLQR
jgi:peptidoglycan/LPS O-acetylase OafA/YrhL